MATSTKTFLIELYEEYLEEASFLYEQRLSLLKNPEISWKKIGEFEERFEAHIDGLVIGESLAIEVCNRCAREGDFGELHAAVRVLCRQNRKELVFAILKELDLQDAEKVRAVKDALKHELPQSWYADFWSLAQANEALIPMAVSAFGYRRANVVDVAKNLPRITRQTPPDLLSDVIWASGRFGEPDVRPALRKYLEHEDEVVRAAAVMAMLRLGDDLTLEHCLRNLRSGTSPLIPVGLAGSHSVVKTLLDVADKYSANDNWLIAVGLLGDISAVPTLLGCLSNPETAEAAAIALSLITGAKLCETVFVPDDVDEDELFEGERENLKRGQVPVRADGKPFGITVTRLSQKVEDWQVWWTQNELSFDGRIGYRNGKPLSPGSLLEVLRSEKSPHMVRQLMHEEFVIRYGMDIPFEADMFVEEQVRAIEKVADWVQMNSGRFREGAYYFGGRLTFS
jgi:uncharacterized protein (TIGR02270 family)